jgi:hypothetical protein
LVLNGKDKPKALFAGSKKGFFDALLNVCKFYIKIISKIQTQNSIFGRFWAQALFKILFISTKTSRLLSTYF